MSNCRAPSLGTRFVVVLIVASSMPLQAVAHHSFAAFDMSREVKLSGVVETYDWTNPHVGIALMAMDEGGKQKEWLVEAASIGLMTRAGWNRSTLQPGQKVTLSVHPLKTGEAAGGLVGAVLSDGRVLGSGSVIPALPIR